MNIYCDPGKSGAFAWCDKGTINTQKMPSTFPDIAEFLKELKSQGYEKLVLEKVGFHRVGNSASSSVKFSRHMGHLEAIGYCMGLKVDYISPQVWMKKLGSLPKEKKDRKNKIKELMQLSYPSIKVTLALSDALGMYHALEIKKIKNKGESILDLL